MAGQQFEYDYDSIGNRTTSAEGGDTVGASLRLTQYSANSFNQYTSRTAPGFIDIVGTAATNATVTVNNATTARQGEYFRAELGVGNVLSPVWAGVTNAAVVVGAGTNGTDVVDSVSGHRYVAQTPEAFEYDADGNLTRDGRWDYTWNGENRLIAMETIAEAVAAGTPKQKLEFAYDLQGRRISKKVYDWNASTNGWQLTTDQRFVYDGWNLIATLDAGPSTLVQSYLWGLDLSRTLDGAGGVGGLLVVSNLQSPIGTHFAAYDGNGNVTTLVNASDASVGAVYEYNPFGQQIRCEGVFANANPFRFSTKFTDDETGLVYYGYRYYSPALGRWLSEDPIEEEGGLNIYAFVENNALSHFDLLGMDGTAVETEGATGEAAGLDAGGAGQAIRFKNAVREAIDAYTDFQDIILNVWDIMDSAGISGADDFLIDALSKGNDALSSDLKGAGKQFERHHTGTVRGKHRWNNAFRAVFSALGFDADSDLNVLPLPGHRGRHRTAYHEMIGERLGNILENAEDFRSARKAFVREILNIKKDLLNNPNLLRGL